MVRSGAFQRALSDAARKMQVEIGPQATMDAAVQLAAETIPGCDMAGVSIARRDSVDTPSATSEALRRADELQYALGEGPCLDALREQEAVHSQDLSSDPRWPRWGPNMVSEVGMYSVMSHRLFVTEDGLGALNFYGATKSAYDSEALAEGVAFAAAVAVALASAQNESHLQIAIDARTLTGQATGMLMERFHLSATQAFALMTRVSSQQNMKIRTLAEEIVRTAHMPGVPDRPSEE